jgi:predicted nucleic acid-binding protein
MSADWAYLDSSAFVKLTIPESETEALERYMVAWPAAASSALLMAEVLRAARRHRPERVAAVRQRLQDVVLLAIDGEVLQSAAELGPEQLRTLDAIHLATARQLGEDLGVIITYDRRLADAATELGLPVASPA